MKTGNASLFQILSEAMRPACIAGLILLSILFITGAGCETKAHARFEAEQAYVAGQEKALADSKPKPPTVTIRGEVLNSIIPWTSDLTLAKAIVSATYTGYMRPRFIRVIHDGATTEFTGNDLLAGQDMPLEAGDVVEIVP